MQGKEDGFQFADEAKESMHLIEEDSADKKCTHAGA